MDKINLKGLSAEEIRDSLGIHNIPAFRSKQLFQWIHQKNVDDFDAMTNLSKELRKFLSERYEIRNIHIQKKAISEDGTIKYLFTLPDGGEIESVLLPPISVNRIEQWTTDDEPVNRLTICVSTQVGCPLGCEFCATGYMKYKRNLSVSEIIDQILQTSKESGKQITNIVFMGMGEPLLNYENLIKAIDIISSETGLKISNKHITVSTSGIIPGIVRIADEKRKFKLAVSLHSLDDEVRSSIMPINNKYKLPELIESIKYYYRKTKIRPTFEYILFDGLNDTETDMKRIIKLSKELPCKFNMIKFHESDIFSLDLKQSRRFTEFINDLRNNNVTVMVRNSSGEDINAACGQLAIKYNS